MDQIQSIQENEYQFPYHYIAEFENGDFRSFVYDWWGLNYASTIEFLLKEIDGINGMSFADVGCGDGRLVREVAKRKKYAKIFGIDYSERAISLARIMNRDLEEVDWCATDIAASTNIDDFDVITLIEVLEHIHPRMCGAFLRGVRRRMRRGGTLLVTVPHVNQPLEAKHYRHFTSKSLLAEFGREFQLVEVKPFEKKGKRRELLNKLLANRLFILRNQKLLNMLYRFYKRFLFDCNTEEECLRLYLKCVAT